MLEYTKLKGVDNMNTRLKELRLSLNLSQEAFGRKLGVGKTAISKLELGENKISEPMIKLICKEFNVSSAWLKDGIGDMYNDMDIDLLNKVDEIISGEDEFYKNLLRTIVNLSDEDLLLFKKMVDNLTKKS